MRTSIIRIGNSQGVRIPKILLEQSQIGTEVDIEVEDKKIVIQPASSPRSDWDKKFELMAKRKDDKLIDNFSITETEWDKMQWEW